MSRVLNLIAALSGSPSTGEAAQVSTPALFDNDKSVPTTEFVQRALGNFAGVTNLTSSGAALNAAHSGRYLAIQGGVTSVVLPDAATVPFGTAFYLHNVTTDGTDCVVSRQGTDVISAHGGKVNTITIKGGTSVEFVKALDGIWYATGTGVLGVSYAMDRKLEAKGYQRLPSGLIVNWGLEPNIASGASAVVSFATGGAFPTAAFAAFTSYSMQTGNPAAGSVAIGQVRGLSQGSVTIRNLYSASADFYWFAIGV